jgi:hypothetical protein
MKTIIMLLLAAFVMSHTTSAQKMTTDQVPAAVVSGFVAKFPGVTKQTWERENEMEYEANFKLNGVETSASFDPAGKWLETETEIKTSALPAPIQKAVSKDFAGYKINEASKIESAKDGSCFEAEIEKGEESYDVVYTPDGKMLSKTKKDEEKGDKD